MSKFISGIAHLGGVAVYIGAILIHIWTAIIAYNYSGTFFGILSFFTPFFSEIYWLFVSWKIDKFQSPYIQWVIVLVVAWIVVILLSMFSGYLSNREQLAVGYAIENDSENPYYYGFGGWLIPLAISFIVGCWNSSNYIFDFLYPLSSEGGINDLISDNSMYGVLIFGEWTYHIGRIALMLLAGYLCFKQKLFFKKAVISFLLFNFSMAVLFYFLYLTVPETAASSSENLTVVFQSAVYATVWCLYIIKSKRVANTFIK
ncbi:MAG: DUF2569 family protein [Bacilli bacterium]